MLYLGSSAYGIYTDCRENKCCSLMIWAILVISVTVTVVVNSVIDIVYQVVT